MWVICIRASTIGVFVPLFAQLSYIGTDEGKDAAHSESADGTELLPMLGFPHDG
jgi:hypothetical protein